MGHKVFVTSYQGVGAARFRDSFSLYQPAQDFVKEALAPPRKRLKAVVGHPAQVHTGAVVALLRVPVDTELLNHGQRRRAQHARVGTEMRRDDAHLGSLRKESSLSHDAARRLEQQLARRRRAAANHYHLGVEDVDEARDADTEESTSLHKDRASLAIASLRETRHQLSRNRLATPALLRQGRLRMTLGAELSAFLDRSP
jgi:hypothetical protein